MLKVKSAHKRHTQLQVDSGGKKYLKCTREVEYETTNNTYQEGVLLSQQFQGLGNKSIWIWILNGHASGEWLLN